MITVITGSNRFLIQQKLADLKASFIKTHGEAGLEIFTAEQLDAQKLQSLLTGVSLFAENRLVIIKNLSQLKELSEQFLTTAKQIPEEISVILVEDSIDKRTAFYKTLKKTYEVIECSELSEGELQKWVTKQVAQEGGKAASSTVRLLIEYVGPDQLRLANEISKLVAYNKDVTENAINELVEKRPEDTIFQLLETSLSGRRDQALAILDGLERAHEDPFAIANMLIWQTHILAVVFSAKTTVAADIAKQTKFNPFVVGKTKQIANRLSEQQFERILESVASLDVTLKTSSADPWRIIEQTILSF